MDLTMNSGDYADSDKASTKHMSAASTPTNNKDVGGGMRPRSCQGSPAYRQSSEGQKGSFQCQSCLKLRHSLLQSHETIHNLTYKLQIQDEKYSSAIAHLEEKLAREVGLRRDEGEGQVREDVAVMNRMVVELEIYATELRRENQALKMQVDVFRELVENKIEPEAVFRTLFADDLLKLESTYQANLLSLNREYSRCQSVLKARITSLQSLEELVRQLFEKWRGEGRLGEDGDLLAAKLEAVERGGRDRRSCGNKG